MSESAIEWTDSTWNPVAGCSVMSAGCTNCYAMQMARRLEAMGMDKYRGLTRRSGSRTVWKGVVREDHGSLGYPGPLEKAEKGVCQLHERLVPSGGLGRLHSRGLVGD